MVLPNLVIDGKLKNRFERRDKRGLCSLTTGQVIRRTIFQQVNFLALIYFNLGLVAISWPALEILSPKSAIFGRPIQVSAPAN
jgi:hypothetical protein